MTSATHQSCLFDLPCELRMSIYKFVFEQSGHWDDRSYERPAILRTCRQIHTEAASVLYTATRVLAIPFGKKSDYVLPENIFENDFTSPSKCALFVQRCVDHAAVLELTAKLPNLQYTRIWMPWVWNIFRTSEQAVLSKWPFWSYQSTTREEYDESLDRVLKYFWYQKRLESGWTIIKYRDTR